MNEVTALFALLLLAATPEDPARDLYVAGSEAYRQGQYDVALRAFEEVLRVDPRPAAMFSAAQAHRLQFFVDQELEHLERSVTLYRQYLEAAPDGGRRSHAARHLATLTPLLERRRAAELGDAPEEPEVSRIIVSSKVEGAVAVVGDSDPTPIPAGFEVEPGKHRVRVTAPGYEPAVLDTVAVAGSVVALNPVMTPTPGTLTVRAPDGARVRLDGREIGRSPLPSPLVMPPGSHVVAVTDRGRNAFVRQLDVGRGEALAVDAELSVTNQRYAAWAALAAGGALLIGAGATYAVTVGKERDAEALEDRLATQGLTVAEATRYRELEDDRDGLAQVTTGLGIGAAVALGTGLVLWIFDEPDGTPGLRLSGAGVADDGVVTRWRW